MKLSFIIIDGRDLNATLESIRFQSFQDYEVVTVPRWNGEESSLRSIVELVKGEYCLVLNAGDILRHDRVIEECFFDNDTENFLIGNILIKNNESKSDRYLNFSNIFKASDLILNFIPMQAVFFNRKIALEYIIDTNDLISDFYIFLINGIVLKGLAYNCINTTISVCYIDEKGVKSLLFANGQLHKSVKPLLPKLFSDYNDLFRFYTINNIYPINKYLNSHLFEFLNFSKKVLNDLGYFKLKEIIKRRSHYKKIKEQDANIKKQIGYEIDSFESRTENISNSNFIVSLTSHGSRVENSAPYAIYSIFTQKVKPDKVVLNLNQEKWNSENLPYLIKKLEKVGLEVNFCVDVGPHTKLLPTLSMYPNDVIITVDDDVYYNDSAMEELYGSYQDSDKKTILCRKGGLVERQLGKFIPYTQWKPNSFGNQNSEIIAHGVGGVLYPANIFCEKIFDADLFKKLCPYEDDMWFWVIERLNNVKIRLVEDSSYNLDRYVDNMEQFFSKNSLAMHHQNNAGRRSNVQLDNLSEVFQLDQV